MMQFAEQFTDKQILVTLLRQSSWPHFLAILPIKIQMLKAICKKYILQIMIGQ